MPNCYQSIRCESRQRCQAGARYQIDLEHFGEIRFEIRFSRQGKNTEFAKLDERQAALLLSLMRNTAKVVEFKVHQIE
jgi:hypothetical protein